MNQKFFSLPEEKRRRILNAGYRAFSGSSYKKCPVGEIAEEAGISKSLLFHYFQNKKELYLFLWEEAAHLTERYLAEVSLPPGGNLFDYMETGMEAKLRIMADYPDLAAFALRAFYEKDPAVCGDIARRCEHLVTESNERLIRALNPADYLPGLDLRLMYRELYWASDGCMRSLMLRQPPDIPAMRKEFTALIGFWRGVYLRKREG
ncbi:MAG: TetR/AcrR family transcriptional regulator [Oscillospiraceae bacterium]|nr:TetR/AcrR family transcriptional regulator [Oscillospiraceae bacterium]